MGIIKNLFSKSFREEYSTEISMRINSEQEEYNSLYNSILINVKAEEEKVKDNDSI